ncbi:zinc finger CW-type PWWP domain protein 2 isoform X1 [Pseudophryne corroboree]|uniref:zinc finger CW-type PWWP domain protein 2 isoform X1 n=1 Tax=Pseudophryne corroboree TaxID=495146 RepID=UPI0030817010
MEDKFVSNIERPLFTEVENGSKKHSFNTNFYLNKVWLQCENESCLKWRLLTKRDARQFDLSKPWYCHLSTDPWFNDCSVPEEHFPEEAQFYENGLKFVYTQFPVGSLVMVKLNRWPSWPAIITVDPVNGQEVTYFKYYYVEFLGKPHTSGLVSLESISPYSTPVMAKKVKKAGRWYKSALEEADKLYSLTCEQRTQMCHVTQEHIKKLTKPKRKYVRKNAAIESNAKKRRLKENTFQPDEPNEDDCLSQEDSEMYEAEDILPDFGWVLQGVANPLCAAKKLHAEKDTIRNNDGLEDHTSDDDCIIDGVQFKSEESIEAITQNLKQIDCIMSKFTSQF